MKISLVAFGLAVSTFLVLSVCFTAQANDIKNTEREGQYNNIKVQMSKLKMSVTSIEDSPISGLYQVLTNKGLYYYSAESDFLIDGKLYNVKQNMKNETASALAKIHQKELPKMLPTMIEYKAKNEKHVINVFTDITCGYCKRMHKEVSEYNNLGITVRYLAYPRYGLNSQSHTDLSSIWCADDKVNALNEAKYQDKLVAKTCDYPVSQHFNFAQSTGVKSTPSIMLDDGSLLVGYRAAKTLLKALDAKLYPSHFKMQVSEPLSGFNSRRTKEGM